MGIVPYPVPPPLKTLREGQIPQRQTGHYHSVWHSKSSLVRVWNEYDCLAARMSAPIWLFVWIMTVGKMGRGLWKLDWSTPTPIDIPMPLTKPPALNQIPHVVNRKCTYGFTKCSGRECQGRCLEMFASRGPPPP